LNLKE